MGNIKTGIYRHYKGNMNEVIGVASHSIDWKGESTYVQSVAVVNDYGVFDSPDEFFAEHKQAWGIVKNFAYVHYGRKVMNRNVRRIRNGK